MLHCSESLKSGSAVRCAVFVRQVWSLVRHYSWRNAYFVSKNFRRSLQSSAGKVDPHWVWAAPDHLHEPARAPRRSFCDGHPISTTGRQGIFKRQHGRFAPRAAINPDASAIAGGGSA